MLLSEQTRQLPNEQNNIDYPSAGEAGLDYTWKTFENFGTVTLTSAGAIAFALTSPGVDPNYRLKIGNYYVWGTQVCMASTANGIAYLPTGAHAIVMESKRTPADSSGTLTNFYCGRFKLADENTSGTLGEYAGAISVSIPVRQTPAGTIKNAVVCVRAFGTRTWAGTAAQCQFANIGESFTGSVALKIDGDAVSWTDRQQDTAGTACAYAYYYGTLSLSSAHTITLEKGTETTVHISVYASPWLLPGTVSPNQPLDLLFPQGSTFYAMLEPLDTVSLKEVKIGKKRAVSFGTATDYYYTESGTALLSASYTYDIVKPETTEFHAGGLGGCISHVAVDVR